LTDIYQFKIKTGPNQYHKCHYLLLSFMILGMKKYKRQKMLHL